MKAIVAPVVLIMVVLSGCPENKDQVISMINAEAPVIIYKTRQDYSNRVPIMMNGEKTEILAFPGPGDLYFEGKLALPTPLINGYLLDNRGLSPRSAFLSYTYEEYAALSSPPDPAELMKNILDADPFMEMYECGKRSELEEIRKDLKKIIRNDFQDCKKIK